ncbi:BTAD domain-containing putative transcriptional regulator [Actinokineospora sp. 24-640]
MTGGFGAQLIAHRRRVGITQQELAQRAGISVRALRDIEQGRVKQPHAQSLRRLTAVLGDQTGSERAVRVSVLGPLLVRRAGEAVDPGPAMQRRLLGLLALQANEAVSREEIVDFLWGNRIPATYPNLIHTYVARLRKLLDDEGRLSRAGSGYRLTLATEQCDLLEFQAATVDADEDAYDQALALWRGPVLSDVDPGLAQHPAAVAAVRQRTTAVLAHADLAIRRGAHQQALRRLWEALQTDPLHEGVNARIMLALAASGQRVAALRLFKDVSTQLDESLGIAPGPELEGVYLRILRQESGQAEIGSALVPAQLPPGPATFSGRAAHLRELDAQLSLTGGRAAVTVISGTAGVGKTSLAVHWAHRVRHRFSDGQLFFNLHGYSESAPRTAGDALNSFLQALGVPPAAIPLDVDTRGALLRSMLADRRVLLVLDNAVSAEQVRPLIPANPNCAVVVTSRNDLSGLRVRDDALILRLDVLTHAEATDLLRALVHGEPDTVDELARLCAHLPLALRIAAANVCLGAYESVADYTAALRDGNRLRELSVSGDSTTAVHAAFALSYAALDPRAARAFRLLGLVPGADIGLPAAATLLGMSVEEAAGTLDQLVAAHLVQRRARDRFHFHDLLRLFAAQRCVEEDDDAEREHARQRLLLHYLHSAHHATSSRYPGMLRLCDIPPFVTAAAAPPPDDWLEAERANLSAMVQHMAEHGPRMGAWLLTDVLRGFLWRTYDVQNWETMSLAGLAAAEAENDQRATAAMHYSAGAAAQYCLCDTGIAEERLERAQQLFRELGATHGRAAALDGLGMVHHKAGRAEQAVKALGEALDLCRRERSAAGTARVLCNLGEITAGTAVAFDHLAEALSLAGLLADRHIEGHALHNLGYAHWRAGQFDDAMRDYRRALELREEIGDTEGRGTTMDAIGTLLCATGNPTTGRRYWYEALVTLESIGHPVAEEIRARLADLR